MQTAKYKKRYDFYGRSNAYGRYDQHGNYRANDPRYKKRRAKRQVSTSSSSSQSEAEEEEESSGTSSDGEGGEEEESSGEYPPDYFEMIDNMDCVSMMELRNLTAFMEEVKTFALMEGDSVTLGMNLNNIRAVVSRYDAYRRDQSRMNSTGYPIAHEQLYEESNPPEKNGSESKKRRREEEELPGDEEFQALGLEAGNIHCTLCDPNRFRPERLDNWMRHCQSEMHRNEREKFLLRQAK